MEVVEWVSVNQSRCTRLAWEWLTGLGEVQHWLSSGPCRVSTGQATLHPGSKPTSGPHPPQQAMHEEPNYQQMVQRVIYRQNEDTNY